MSTLTVPWKLLSWRHEVPVRNRRWRAILDAALMAPAYARIRPNLEWARHLSPYRVAAGFVDPLPLPDLFANPALYRNPRAAAPKPAPFAAPWPGAVQGALALCPWFPVDADAGITHDPQWDAVQRTEPEVLAGPAPALLSLASAMLERKLALPTLRWGVVGWSGPGRPMLDAASRAALWWAFQVPVAEQYRGFDGEILAENCEARDGWHIQEDTALWEAANGALPGPLRVTSLVNLRFPALRLECGIHGRLSTVRCECGRDTPRLLTS